MKVKNVNWKVFPQDVVDARVDLKKLNVEWNYTKEILWEDAENSILSSMPTIHGRFELLESNQVNKEDNIDPGTPSEPGISRIFQEWQFLNFIFQ